MICAIVGFGVGLFGFRWFVKPRSVEFYGYEDPGNEKSAIVALRDCRRVRCGAATELVGVTQPFRPALVE